MSKRQTRQPPKVTWAQAFRDTMTTAMNRGQAPFYCFFIIIVILLLRMPSNQMPHLAEDFLQLLAAWKITGWVLLVLVIFAWGIHAKTMRKKYSAEYSRVGDEKSKLQATAAGRAFPSSEGG